MVVHTVTSNGVPQPDDDLKHVTRKKIIPYRSLYEDLPDPIVFMSVAVTMQ